MPMAKQNSLESATLSETAEVNDFDIFVIWANVTNISYSDRINFVFSASLASRCQDLMSLVSECTTAAKNQHLDEIR